MLDEQPRGDKLPEKCYITYISEQAKTRELDVVDGWDFSCANARKWQRLLLPACGVTLDCRRAASWLEFKFEFHSNLPYVTCR